MLIDSHFEIIFCIDSLTKVNRFFFSFIDRNKFIESKSILSNSLNEQTNEKHEQKKFQRVKINGKYF